ncbi:MAG: hypothetical protein KAW46_06670, partial [candidate division Zixibacteria bacterium]|nr:hypothetical protein [candidate division Zixibacteria bacterium]
TAYLAFKEKSRQRSRHKKLLQATREKISGHERELENLERAIEHEISPEDWERLNTATVRKKELEEELLGLYARLEKLEEVDLD